MRQLNGYKPLTFSDGRIYDVLLFQVVADDPAAGASRTGASSVSASRTGGSGIGASLSNASTTGTSAPGTNTTVRRFCAVEVLQRDVELSHHFFYFRLYQSIFDRGEVSDTEQSLVLFTRQWINRYLETHREPMPLSRQAQPIVVECR